MNPVSSARSAARICIVVPCYNEENRFDVGAFDRHLAAVDDVSFLLVNDGSNDATLGILDGLARKHPDRVRAIDLNPNQGKAEAVRHGLCLALASGQFTYAGYWDADLATPLEAIPMFVDVFERLPDIDMVFGTRVKLLGRQIERRALRHYLGRMFATVASLVLSLPIYDTQCGAKLFRAHHRNAALFAAPFGSRWIFDVEIVARYLQAARAPDAPRADPGRVAIYELPLDRWMDVGESKVRGVDFARALGEMAAIYRTYRLPGAHRSLLRLVTAPFVRYTGAGAIGTAVHYLTLLAAVELMHMPPTTGSAAGATIGALVNYVLNYHVTFASKQSHSKTFPRFLTVAVCGILLNSLVVKFASARLHYLVAQLLATLLVLATGYLLNSFWTFDRARGR